MDRKKIFMFAFCIIVIMAPGSVNAQQTISHGTKKPTRQQRKPTRTKEMVIRDLCNNMVYVQGGTFLMGATLEQADFDDASTPSHSVTVSSFYIGKYEVTQEEWKAVMGNNPSKRVGLKLPVESVSWNDCKRFIKKLNEATGRSFRLPTEAEWEYAARGGKNEYLYSGSNNFGEIGWCKENGGKYTHIVGQKKANEFGIYDMSGNVGEWCEDWWKAYSIHAQTNPKGPSTGNYRVTRGGSVNASVKECRVYERYGDEPDASYWNIGFRLAEF